MEDGGTKSLFIPVMLERLPDSIKLKVTRKLRMNNWHISDFINCIKEEVDAHENCDFIKDKNDYEHLTNTTHSLLAVQKMRQKTVYFVENYITVISVKMLLTFQSKRKYYAMKNVVLDV